MGGADDPTEARPSGGLEVGRPICNPAVLRSASRFVRNSIDAGVDNAAMEPIATLVPWHAHASTRLFVHVIWSTRHRSAWLEPRHDAPLAALLDRKARSIHCALLAVGNASDHVHVLVQHPPRVSVSQIAHRLKGASSWALHRAGIASVDTPIWQVGYWAESVGHRELEPLVQYVRAQRLRHRDGLTSEPWEAPLQFTVTGTPSPPEGRA